MKQKEEEKRIEDEKKRINDQELEKTRELERKKEEEMINEQLEIIKNEKQALERKLMHTELERKQLALCLINEKQLAIDANRDNGDAILVNLYNSVEHGEESESESGSDTDCDASDDEVKPADTCISRASKVAKYLNSYNSEDYSNVYKPLLFSIVTPLILERQAEPPFHSRRYADDLIMFGELFKDVDALKSHVNRVLCCKHEIDSVITVVMRLHGDESNYISIDRRGAKCSINRHIFNQIIVDRLLSNGFKNIVIIDNSCSSKNGSFLNNGSASSINEFITIQPKYEKMISDNSSYIGHLESLNKMVEEKLIEVENMDKKYFYHDDVPTRNDDEKLKYLAHMIIDPCTSIECRTNEERKEKDILQSKVRRVVGYDTSYLVLVSARQMNGICYEWYEPYVNDLGHEKIYLSPFLGIIGPIMSRCSGIKDVGNEHYLNHLLALSQLFKRKIQPIGNPRNEGAVSEGQCFYPVIDVSDLKGYRNALNTDEDDNFDSGFEKITVPIDITLTGNIKYDAKWLLEWKNYVGPMTYRDSDDVNDYNLPLVKYDMIYAGRIPCLMRCGICQHSKQKLNIAC